MTENEYYDALSKSGAAYGSVSVTASATEILPYSPNRTSYVISAPTSGRITLGFDNQVTDGTGIVLSAAGFPYQVPFSDYGDMARKAVYGIASPSTVVVGFMANYSQRK